MWRITSKWTREDDLLVYIANIFCRFQYILAAATSIATKNNEETLTYLNQGQSYEIKLKKIGDLSFYRDKILKVSEMSKIKKKKTTCILRSQCVI